MNITQCEKTNDIATWVSAVFQSYNTEFDANDNSKPYCFEVTENNIRIGVALGTCLHRWSKISAIVVDGAHRKSGVGKALLERIEIHAKDNNCVGMSLTTATFQAPDFYKKYGFEEFARLEPYAGEHASIFMKKVF